jgi:hypothetical protein
MNNKPVAYMDKKGFVITNEESAKEHGFAIPLYTHPNEQAVLEAFERGKAFGYAQGIKDKK